MSIVQLMEAVIIAVLSSTGLWAFLDNCRKDNKEEKEKEEEKVQRDKERDGKLDKLIDDIKELKADMKKSADLSKAVSRDRLNYLCQDYIKIGYIPSSDYAAFKLLGEAYLDAGGNSEVGEKYIYIINNLKVRDVE